MVVPWVEGGAGRAREGKPAPISRRTLRHPDKYPDLQTATRLTMYTGFSGDPVRNAGWRVPSIRVQVRPVLDVGLHRTHTKCGQRLALAVI